MVTPSYTERLAMHALDLDEDGHDTGGGVTDHGALSGLADDDHPQYTTAAEAMALAATEVGTHTADATDAHDASAISIVDAGNHFTGTDVEAALQELGAGGGGGGSLTVEEVDGTPSVSNVDTIRVSNGTLTDDGGGQVTIDTSGGGGSDLVQVASGAGSVRIHGLASSPDIPPASAGSLDDEFDTTDTTDPLTGWTTLQTPTAHDINSTFKSHYYVKRTAVNSSAGHVGIYKSWTPNAGEYVWCKVSDCVVSRNSFQAGFVFFVSDGTKYEMLRLIFDGSIVSLRLTAYNTVGTPTTDIAGALAGDGAMRPPMYCRVRYNSSTSIDWHFSRDGRLWTPAVLARNPSMTISRVGIGVDTQQASVDGEAAFDFLRSSF